MKLAKAYAQALYELAHDAPRQEQGQYVDRMIATLSAKGHLTLLPRILREYQNYEKIRIRHGARLVCAKQSEIEECKKTLRRFIQQSDTEHTTTETNDNLIGGFIYTHGETIIDASYKTQLLKLYRTMIITTR